MKKFVNNKFVTSRSEKENTNPFRRQNPLGL